MKIQNYKAMQKSIFKITMYLCFILLLVNCSKDDTSEDQSDSSGDTFLTAIVDGEMIEFQEEEINTSSYSAPNGIISTEINGGYVVGAKSILDPELLINQAQTESYVLSCTYFDEQVEWLSTTLQGSNPTTVTLTEFNDNYITGTFSFTGGDFSDLEITSIPQKTITGSFKVKVD